MFKKYIFTHRADYTAPEGYVVIRNYDSPLDHRIWSELAGYRLLYDRIVSGEEGLADDDWITLNHYRRFLRPDYEDRVAVPETLYMNMSLWVQWQMCHCRDDMGLVERALADTYPEYRRRFFEILEGNELTPYTLAHLSVGQFKDYCDFLFRVLGRFGELYGHRSYDDRLEYVRAHPERYARGKENPVPEYQCRIESFAAERLATLYFDTLAARVIIYPCRVELSEPGQAI